VAFSIRIFVEYPAIVSDVFTENKFAKTDAG
jgi:hypothetical protein